MPQIVQIPWAFALNATVFTIMDWFGKADSWDIFERTHGCVLNDVIESLSEQILYIPSLLSAYDGPYGLLAWLAGLLAGWLVGWLAGWLAAEADIRRTQWFVGLARWLAGWLACWPG